MDMLITESGGTYEIPLATVVRSGSQGLEEVKYVAQISRIGTREKLSKTTTDHKKEGSPEKDE